MSAQARAEHGNTSQKIEKIINAENALYKATLLYRHATTGVESHAAYSEFQDALESFLNLIEPDKNGH